MFLSVAYIFCMEMYTQMEGPKRGRWGGGVARKGWKEVLRRGSWRGKMRGGRGVSGEKEVGVSGSSDKECLAPIFHQLIIAWKLYWGLVEFFLRS